MTEYVVVQNNTRRICPTICDVIQEINQLLENGSSNIAVMSWEEFKKEFADEGKCSKCGKEFYGKDGVEYWFGLNGTARDPHGYLCPECEQKFKEWVKQ